MLSFRRSLCMGLYFIVYYYLTKSIVTTSSIKSHGKSNRTAAIGSSIKLTTASSDVSSTFLHNSNSTGHDLSTTNSDHVINTLMFKNPFDLTSAIPPSMRIVTSSQHPYNSGYTPSSPTPNSALITNSMNAIKSHIPRITKMTDFPIIGGYRSHMASLPTLLTSNGGGSSSSGTASSSSSLGRSRINSLLDLNVHSINANDQMYKNFLIRNRRPSPSTSSATSSLPMSATGSLNNNAKNVQYRRGSDMFFFKQLEDPESSGGLYSYDQINAINNNLQEYLEHMDKRAKEKSIFGLSGGSLGKTALADGKSSDNSIGFRSMGSINFYGTTSTGGYGQMPQTQQPQPQPQQPQQQPPQSGGSYGMQQQQQPPQMQMPMPMPMPQMSYGSPPPVAPQPPPPPMQSMPQMSYGPPQMSPPPMQMPSPPPQMNYNPMSPPQIMPPPSSGGASYGGDSGSGGGGGQSQMGYGPMSGGGGGMYSAQPQTSTPSPTPSVQAKVVYFNGVGYVLSAGQPQNSGGSSTQAPTPSTGSYGSSMQQSPAPVPYTGGYGGTSGNGGMAGSGSYGGQQQMTQQPQMSPQAGGYTGQMTSMSAAGSYGGGGSSSSSSSSGYLMPMSMPSNAYSGSSGSSGSPDSTMMTGSGLYGVGIGNGQAMVLNGADIGNSGSLMGAYVPSMSNGNSYSISAAGPMDSSAAASSTAIVGSGPGLDSSTGSTGTSSELNTVGGSFPISSSSSATTSSSAGSNTNTQQQQQPSVSSSLSTATQRPPSNRPDSQITRLSANLNANLNAALNYQSMPMSIVSPVYDTRIAAILRHPSMYSHYTHHLYPQHLYGHFRNHRLASYS